MVDGAVDGVVRFVRHELDADRSDD
jgi:hypothetical protein